MKRQISFHELSPNLTKKLVELGMASRAESLGAGLLDLVNIRASQINGCAFCLDMHVKEAKIRGERELRLYHLPIWRESPLFTEQEKAALEWTEAVTQLPAHGIPDDTFQKVRAHFSEKEMSDLSFAIGIINFFNRMNISFPATPGSMDALFGLGKAGLK